MPAKRTRWVGTTSPNTEPRRLPRRRGLPRHSVLQRLGAGPRGSGQGCPIGLKDRVGPDGLACVPRPLRVTGPSEGFRHLPARRVFIRKREPMKPSTAYAASDSSSRASTITASVRTRASEPEPIQPYHCSGSRNAASVNEGGHERRRIRCARQSASRTSVHGRRSRAA